MAINKMIKKKDTSYEIIWATLRTDPSCLYLELADHPINKMKYTEILDKMKKRRMLCLLSYNEYPLYIMMGITIIVVNSDKAGVRQDNMRFIFSEKIMFLLKSFKASLKGCKIPIIPTLLGPFRI